METSCYDHRVRIVIPGLILLIHNPKTMLIFHKRINQELWFRVRHRVVSMNPIKARLVSKERYFLVKRISREVTN